MSRLELERKELWLVQFNLIVWTVIAITLIISGNFPNMEDISSKNVEGLDMINEVVIEVVHLILIASILASLPIIYLVDRFYRKYLMRFIKITEARIEIKN